MFDKPLHALSATECRTLLDDGHTTANALLQAVLDQHDATHSRINAVIALDIDTARQAAQAADQRLRTGERIGPLDGIPITIKDNIAVRGMPATWGSRLFAQRPCDQDDIAVERLRRSGAVIWGKTNTPELALSGTTENDVYGVTRNPWNDALTPGGSSGGAAAALAACVGALSLGTDAGGSARRPAAYTGTVGFRPSTGQIPRGSFFPNTAHDLQVLAPMARTVADVRMLYSVLRGPDAGDRLSLGLPAPVKKDEQSLRIGLFSTVGTKPVETEIAAAFQAGADVLRSLGHTVSEMPAPYDLARVDKIWLTLISVFSAHFVESHQHQPDIGGGIKALAEQGTSLKATDYLATLEAIQSMRRQFDTLFQEIDFLVCPTSPCFPWAAGQPFPGQIAGSAATLRDTAIFLAFVNVAGLPAISLPLPMPSSLPPAGLQIVGRFGDDDNLLDLAERLNLRMNAKELA